MLNQIDKAYGLYYLMYPSVLVVKIDFALFDLELLENRR